MFGESSALKSPIGDVDAGQDEHKEEEGDEVKTEDDAESEYMDLGEPEHHLR